MKLRHDFAGHYNRPDIFQLHINRSVPHLYTVHGPEEPVTLPDTAPSLRGLSDPETPARLSQPTRAQLGDGKNQDHLSTEDD
jgi:aliphatic nitrilase